jgi:hypothetical protein
MSLNENLQFVDEYERIINIPGLSNISYAKIIKGDFNQDGLTDFIICKSLNSGGLKIYYLNLDRRINTNYLIDLGEFNNLTSKFEHINTGDFNGDGKTDIVFFRGESHNDISIYNLSITNQFELLWKIDFPFIKSSPFSTSPISEIFCEFIPADWGFNSNGTFYYNSPARTIYHPQILGDYNGDGKTDILFPGLDRKLLLSNGKGFVFSSISGYFPGTRELGNMFAEDYNNDGKSDIISITENYTDISFTLTQLAG